MAKKFLLHPATFKLDGGAMFGIIPKPLWERKIKPDELNRIKMSLRVLYIETDNRKILIDTGIGDYHPEKFIHQFEIKSEDSPIEKILAEKSVKAEDITDIIITHLHFDHVGGLGKGEEGHELIFPNATIHLHKDHLTYAKNPGLRDSGSFQSHYFVPVLEQYENKNQINFLQGMDGVILKDGKDEIKFKTSFGHTNHMIHPIVDDLIYMADLVPMGHHVNIPWVMGYDIEPTRTTEYKKEFYDYIIANNLKMVFEHDMETWGGTLMINEKDRYCLKEKMLSTKNSIQNI